MRRVIFICLLLTWTVYFKPIANWRGGIVGGQKELQTICAKDLGNADNHGLHVTACDGHKVFIPWDSIAFIRED